MNVYIVFRSDTRYDGLGSHVSCPFVEEVCSSEDVAKKKIEELHQIPQERQNYYYIRYMVKS